MKGIKHLLGNIVVRGFRIPRRFIHNAAQDIESQGEYFSGVAREHDNVFGKAKLRSYLRIGRIMLTKPRTIIDSAFYFAEHDFAALLGADRHIDKTNGTSLCEA